jgi:lipoprotein-anchoring transpeptidase ErfK/SrfK
MCVVRILCAAAAACLIVSSASAAPRAELAATQMGSPGMGPYQDDVNAPKQDVAATAPIEQEANQAGGHLASDAALSAAVVEELPEEVVEAKPLQRPEPTLFAHIDLTTQRMTVRDASTGEEYGPWKISSARGGYETPTGTYNVHYTARMHYSRQYHWSPMPYSVFFHRGVATHGTNATGSLGRPASHGCVRLHTGNAKTFYNLVERHGKKLTRVVVHGTPPYTPAVAERTRRRRYQEPSFSPFGFFAAQPPVYQPYGNRKRRSRRQQYGGGNYGAW